MNFDALIQTITDIHQRSHASATKAVNTALTLRNWLIGASVHEFELHGENRADYGDALFDKIAGRLTENGVPNCNKSRLYRYRDFYLLYPQIVATLSPQFQNLLPNTSIAPKNETSQKVATVTPLSGKLVLERLSYSHIELLLEIPDPLKRAFYEIESIKGNWSVRELKRQIGSLYFERSGLSRDKEKLSQLANAHALQNDPHLVIRDPYVFDFLDIRPSEALPESDLEAALLTKLQTFLLELGHGFCFEARQKRILIGNEYHFIDLVFYHRVLKSHILVDLKVGPFTHEQLGQLNTYVSYYRAHETTPGDQPPVGILLCTDKNQALVEYALAGMDNRLFVSKYQLELPRPEVLQAYLAEQRKHLETTTPNKNPEEVPSYSPGLPESARATLGKDIKKQPTPTGLPPSIPA